MLNKALFAFLMVISSSSFCYSQTMTFMNLVTNYPGNISSDSVYKLIGGKVLLNHMLQPDNYENSCALRLSRALNYSGYELPYIVGQTGSGSDGKWYFYRVEDLKTMLINILGSLKDITAYNKEEKKGIVLFEMCDFVDATGHLDLWNGQLCAHQCYWDVCQNNKIWPLP